MKTNLRTLPVLAALLLATGTVLLLQRGPSPGPERRPAGNALMQRHAVSGELPLPHVQPAALSKQMQKLERAVEAGRPLLLGGTEALPALRMSLRPVEAVTENFRVSVGGEDNGRAWDVERRTFTGWAWPADQAMPERPARVSLAMAGGALFALVDEPHQTRWLRSDPDSPGDVQVLTVPRGAPMIGGCETDPVTGESTTVAAEGARPVTEGEWLDAPVAPLQPEPVAQASSGFDPATQRLERYVDTIPWGQEYDRSLKHVRLLLVLDKRATGEASAANFAAKTAEQLARGMSFGAVLENQLGMKLLVQEIILTPNTPAYQNVPDSLGGFTGWASTWRNYGTFGWHLASKHGSINEGGGTIGKAWVNTLGQNGAVNVCASGYGVDLMAHECGHNMGANHTAGGIMGGGGDKRSYYTDRDPGYTAAKEIWDNSRNRLAPPSLRNPNEIPFAADDFVTTPLDAPVDFQPLANDARAARHGAENTVMTIAETGRVVPRNAGTVSIVNSETLRFTPAAGYRGLAHFSYSVRGNVGNTGRGWLHKGDVAVEVGGPRGPEINLTLAPGQFMSFRLSGDTPDIATQPRQTEVTKAGDDAKLFLLRVSPLATGTDTFDITQTGVVRTVTITYDPAWTHAEPDLFVIPRAGGSVTFDPTLNDQAPGIRQYHDVETTIGGETANHAAAYFRRKFTIPPNAGIASFRLDVLRDDGAVIYVDGTEVFRSNMPAGTPTHFTQATAAVNDVAETTYYGDIIGGISAGEHWIQAEVHQASHYSSDMAFDLRLNGLNGAGNVVQVLVPSGATWEYWDKGAPPAGWLSPWTLTPATGTATRLTYGPLPNDKPMTAWFRHTFTVVEPETWTEAVLRFHVDDGAVIYLNGTEIHRVNMPAGPVTPLTPALVAATSSMAFPASARVPIPPPGPGPNVLAVEVHQVQRWSSDLAMFMTVMLNRPAGSVEAIFLQSDWKYRDARDAPPADWNLGTFDDSAWPSGPQPLSYPLEEDGKWLTGAGILGFGDPFVVTNIRNFAAGRQYAPAALRMVRATNLTPALGTVTQGQHRFTRDQAPTNLPASVLTFTAAAGATGVAEVEYEIADGAGQSHVQTARIVLPMCGITSPQPSPVTVDVRNGLMLLGTLHASTTPPRTGLPAALWSVISAPPGGTVTFGNPAAAATGARFSLPGVYQVRLTATDGGVSTHDERRINVSAGSGASAIPGLHAWWKLDETNSATAADSAGASHGDRRGYASTTAGWMPGVAGGALDFDGADDAISLTTVAGNFQSLAQGTLALWFRTNTASERTLFSFARSTQTGRNVRLFLRDGTLRYDIGHDAGPDEPSLGTTLLVNDNLWHHAAVTVDAAQRLTLYVDGVPLVSAQRQFFGAVNGINTGGIGRFNNGTGVGSYWRGQIDDIRVYNRPLNAAEVQSLATVGGASAPLVTLPPATVTAPSPALPVSLLGPAVIPPGAILTWSQISGPPGVQISNPAILTPVINFAEDGLFGFRLTAATPDATSFADLTIQHGNLGPGYPVALGIPDIFSPQHAPPLAVALSGAFADETDPPSVLTYTLTGNTNPALFTSAVISPGTPRQLLLTFTGGTGSSRLTVRAADSGGRAVETSFNVTVANLLPDVAAQFFPLPENAAPGTELGQLAAQDPDGDPVLFSIGGGTGAPHFTVHPSTGVLSVAPGAVLNFEAAPVLTLLVRATDAAHPGAFTETPVGISLTDVNEPPVLSPQYFRVRTPGVVTGSSVGLLTAADPELGAVTWSLTAGNTGGAFALDAATGALTVASSGAFDFAARPRFTLTVQASDPAALTATSTVIVDLSVLLAGEVSTARYIVPSSAATPPAGWQSAPAVNGWFTGSAAIGYDEDNDFTTHFLTDIGSSANGVNASVYERVEFSVNSPAAYGGLLLRVKYEDGFVAWLNGVEIARRNAPDTLTWNAAAPAARDEVLAVQWEDIPLDSFATPLRSGANILAIHLLNSAADSSDLLLVPELTALAATAAPYEAWAAANGLTGASTARLADPDGDALTNAAEFAFGGDPRIAGGSLLLQYQLFSAGSQRYADLTFRRRADGWLTGLLYEVQQSTDLLTWTTVESSTTGPPVPDPGGQTEVSTLRAAAGPAGAPAAWLRLAARGL